MQHNEFGTNNGIELTDFINRSYDQQIGRFTQPDPMASLREWLNPFNYCQNNPINRVDPDGMTDGDFINENGKYLGNDGLNDGKTYVIKTKEKKFDNDVKGAGLSKSDSKATEKFIKNNSGNTQAFQNNNIAYSNSVEIEGSQQTRQDMANVVNQDNGNRGTSIENNREYGGSIDNTNTVHKADPGPYSNPKTSINASIEINTDNNTRSTFHSHQSGTIVESSNTGNSSTINMATTNTTYSFSQSPSPKDISGAGSRTNYVFGRGNGTVYVYTSKGVQATIPQKYFATPKNKR